MKIVFPFFSNIFVDNIHYTIYNYYCKLYIVYFTKYCMEQEAARLPRKERKKLK